MQTLQGKRVYVVEFDTMPELPITGLTEEETRYDIVLKSIVGWNLFGLLGDATKRTGRYAEILTAAIETGVISEPGKYALYLVPGTLNWEAYKVIE